MRMEMRVGVRRRERVRVKEQQRVTKKGEESEE